MSLCEDAGAVVAVGASMFGRESAFLLSAQARTEALKTSGPPRVVASSYGGGEARVGIVGAASRLLGDVLVIPVSARARTEAVELVSASWELLLAC